MNKTLIIFTAVFLLGVGFAPPAAAQHYSYYFYGGYYYPIQPPSGYNRFPGGQPPGQEGAVYFRLAPNSRVYRQWDRHNRWSDYLELLRDPLANPEGTLDYMLRTF